MSAEAAITSYLLSVSPPLPAGIDVFQGPRRKVRSSSCIFVSESGGGAPFEYMGGFGTYRTIGLSVFIRGRPNGYLQCKDLADQVWSALQAAEISGYVKCMCDASSPTYLGGTDLEQDEFLVSIRLEQKV
jgi:hypothetical protein